MKPWERPDTEGRRAPTDPRTLNTEGIVDDDGSPLTDEQMGQLDPYRLHNYNWDARRAVIPYAQDFGISHQSDGTSSAAMLFSGRINRSEEHVKVLMLTDADGLAAIVADALGMIERAARSPELRSFVDDFRRAVAFRMANDHPNQEKA